LLQRTKFELILNMRTARDLGLKIPGSILAPATKVIAYGAKSGQRTAGLAMLD
jgi:hypothetical protein